MKTALRGEFSQSRLIRRFNCRLRLEVGAHPDLDRARIVALRGDDSEAGRGCQTEARVGEDVVVEYVGNDSRERQARVLPDLDVLVDTHVHVPVRQAGDRTVARVSGVDAEKGWANLAPDRNRI